MQKRGRRQPRHQRGVFHRVPEPPAAPAQFVVSPPAAQRDADGEKAPGDGRPGARPARPGCIQIAAEQRGDREGERDGKSDIAHVQHGGMQDHARILQQRIQIAAVGRGGNQPLERIRNRQHEQEKSQADESHHAENPRTHRRGQLAREERDGHHPDGQDQGPEEQGSFMSAPHGRQPIVQRQVGIRISRHVEHGEILVRKRIGQTAEGQGDQEKLPARGGFGDGHKGCVVRRRSPNRQQRLHHGDTQSKNQCEMADLRNHGLLYCGLGTRV